MFIEDETTEMRVGARVFGLFPDLVCWSIQQRISVLNPALAALGESRLVGINDAQKTLNLLERIEFLLDSVSAELRIARIDRGEVPAPSAERINAVQEAQSALMACDSKRRESVEVI